MSVIEAYIADLDRALKGPARVKADLLAEGRDSLVDAADAFEHEGLGREAAEQQAVEEFGAIPEIAPGYQAELALAQGRRTALLVAATLAMRHAAAEITWRSLADGWTWSPGAGYRLLAGAVDMIGAAAVVGALLMAVAFGIGVRYVGIRRGVMQAIRLTGMAALAIDGLLLLASLALTGLNPEIRSPAAGGALWALCALTAIPAVWVAASARRCLRVA